MSVLPLTRDLLWPCQTLETSTAGGKGTKVDWGMPPPRMFVHRRWLMLLGGRISKWYSLSLALSLSLSLSSPLSLTTCYSSIFCVSLSSISLFPNSTHLLSPTQIACCDYHSAAVSTVGHLYTFGSKENGKLGHGRDVPSGSTGNVIQVSKFLDSDQTTDMGDVRIGYVSSTAILHM